MIITENTKINNVDFIHTYSDAGFKIECDGELYDEAFDLATRPRTYTETNIEVDPEATEEELLKILLGEDEDA